jgi:hypothetical protein
MCFTSAFGGSILALALALARMRDSLFQSIAIRCFWQAAWQNPARVALSPPLSPAVSGVAEAELSELTSACLADRGQAGSQAGRPASSRRGSSSFRVDLRQIDLEQGELKVETECWRGWSQRTVTGGLPGAV